MNWSDLLVTLGVLQLVLFKTVLLEGLYLVFFTREALSHTLEHLKFWSQTSHSVTHQINTGCIR